MVEFIKGLLTLLGSVILSLILIPLQTIYSIGYSIYWSVKHKCVWCFFKFWWKHIDGIFAGVGHMLWNIGWGLDVIWNVQGEMLEDIVTDKESTMFADKRYPVSASIGQLELEDRLVPSGKKLSKFLNFIFWQKNHAVDSWLYTKARYELKSKYFLKKNK